MASGHLGRYKTEFCDFYWRSHGCRHGHKCNYAHSLGECRGKRDHPWFQELLRRDPQWGDDEALQGQGHWGQAGGGPLHAAGQWAGDAQNLAARAPEFADEQKCMAGHLMVESQAIIHGTCDECKAIIGHGAQLFACTACSPTLWRCSGCQKARRRCWQASWWDNQSVAELGGGGGWLGEWPSCWHGWQWERDPARPALQADEITDHALEGDLLATLKDDLATSVHGDLKRRIVTSAVEEEDQPRGGEEEQEEPRFLSENPPPLDQADVPLLEEESVHEDPCFLPATPPPLAPAEVKQAEEESVLEDPCFLPDPASAAQVKQAEEESVLEDPCFLPDPPSAAQVKQAEEESVHEDPPPPARADVPPSAAPAPAAPAPADGPPSAAQVKQAEEEGGEEGEPSPASAAAWGGSVHSDSSNPATNPWMDHTESGDGHAGPRVPAPAPAPAIVKDLRQILLRLHALLFRFQDSKAPSPLQLTLQLFAAEGYRHTVVLIDHYLSSRLVRTEVWGWCGDGEVALKQTCRAVHAWYHWTREEREAARDLDRPGRRLLWEATWRKRESLVAHAEETDDAGDQEDDGARGSAEAQEDDGVEMMLTYDKDRDGALSPQQAFPLLNRRSSPLKAQLSGLFGELETHVDEALAADDRAESEGRALVAELLAGKMLVDVSGADVAAGSGANHAADEPGEPDEPLGVGIDRLILRHDIVGTMKE